MEVGRLEAVGPSPDVQLVLLGVHWSGKTTLTAELLRRRPWTRGFTARSHSEKLRGTPLGIRASRFEEGEWLPDDLVCDAVRGLSDSGAHVGEFVSKSFPGTWAAHSDLRGDRHHRSLLAVTEHDHAAGLLCPAGRNPDPRPRWPTTWALLGGKMHPAGSVPEKAPARSVRSR